MTDFSEKLNTAAQHIVLMPDEKDAMRSALASAMHRMQSPARSPYQRFVRRPHYAIMSAVLIMGVTAGTAFAAQGSLPGDLLYPVKRNITEPAMGAVQFSPQAQVSWHAAIAERRATEAEQLAANGKLTPVEASDLADNVDAHVSAAASLITQENDDSTHDAAVPARIGAVLAAHGAILSAIGSEASSTAEANTTALLAQKISEQSFVLLAIGVPRNLSDVGTTTASSTNEMSLVTPKAKKTEESNGHSIRTVLITASSTNGSSTELVASTSESKGAQSESLSSAVVQSAAATTSGIGSGDLADIRDQAVAAIAGAKSQGKGLSDYSSFSDAITGAENAVQQGDNLTPQSEVAAFAKYRQAFLTAVSLDTILHAASALPNYHGLPHALPNLTISTIEDAHGSP